MEKETLEFVANGGETASVTKTYGVQESNREITLATEIAAATKYGYTFTAWTENSDHASIANGILTIDADAYNDFTVTANYTANTVTVTYANAEHGTFVPTSDVYTYNADTTNETTYKFPTVTAAGGYAFAGWTFTVGTKTYTYNGKTYDEILNDVYAGSGDIDSARCAAVGNIDYGDYTLSSDGHTILHQPLDEFLEDNGTSLEEFNKLIADNVEDAGFGTRAGVVAAAVTLIGELGDNFGVKVPYYWGGGHSSNDLSGEALAKWGSTQCHTFANGNHYNYCGLDCSGFVAWALNAGGFRCGPTGAGSFYEKNGAQKVKLNPNAPVLQPGDILEYVKIVGGERVSGHAILVVGIDEDTKEYICIEAQGKDYGVLFTRRSFGLDGYWGVDMEDFYNNPSNLREPRE